MGRLFAVQRRRTAKMGGTRTFARRSYRSDGFAERGLALSALVTDHGASPASVPLRPNRQTARWNNIALQSGLRL